MGNVNKVWDNSNRAYILYTTT